MTNYAPISINADYPAHRINWVGQEEPNGCVAATLAMMLACPYADAAGMLKRFGDGDCYSTIQRQLILFDRGWAKCERGRKRPDGTRWDWPPRPFAPVHIVSVKISEGAPVYHSVIWLPDGTVLDPLTPEPKRLRDYYHIGGIDGWINLAILPAQTTPGESPNDRG